MSNYIQSVRKKVKEKTECTGRLLDLYTLLVFVKGEDCTLEDVHDAWSIWRNKTEPEHKSLIPFEELDKEVQEYDRKYTEAIQEVAKNPKT